MRLVNTTTFNLEYFVEGSIPPYACFSHRWGSEEVTFQEWQDRSNVAIDTKDGYGKVIAACRQAKIDGLNYLWADTCCIDKTSSAELSEAINSMWIWYRECVFCIAYLADVNDTVLDGHLTSHDEHTLAASEWFLRAWTLQELLAPSDVRFFNLNWALIGTKVQLADEISNIANIHREAVTKFSIKEWSIAQRMSWASSRKATRTEDVAYSLLGVFDVNMPLLYGEGRKAFLRLQEEIIRRSTDTSILAWTREASDGALEDSLIFALSPREFRKCSSIVGCDKTTYSSEPRPVSSYALTNLGLRIELELSPLRMDTWYAHVGAHAQDTWGRKDRYKFICIIVRRVSQPMVLERCVTTLAVIDEKSFRNTHRYRNDKPFLCHVTLRSHQSSTYKTSNNDSQEPVLCVKHYSVSGTATKRFHRTKGDFIIGEEGRSLGYVLQWLGPGRGPWRRRTFLVLRFDWYFNLLCLRVRLSPRRIRQLELETGQARWSNYPVWSTQSLPWRQEGGRSYRVVGPLSLCPYGKGCHIYKFENQESCRDTTILKGVNVFDVNRFGATTAWDVIVYDETTILKLFGRVFRY